MGSKTGGDPNIYSPALGGYIHVVGDTTEVPPLLLVSTVPHGVLFTPTGQV